MESLVIAAGCDHAGINFKQQLIQHMQSKDATIIDVGCFPGEVVDYPIYAKAVCDKINQNQAQYGLIVCGGGMASSMAANKFLGIRCALCHDYWTAETSRKKYNCNVIALGERTMSYWVAEEIVDIFFATKFDSCEDNRRRINLIDSLI
ncbi:unnamed protein product [Blepharisma stoltei]|uniref:Ribose-5-phosphate isomerase n=1 Tax=Blepharisma stoltei TaxID=1481888 RepID=A0AAU9J1Y7_9CILI|nr:unnamed protein product [Blepharisma stoltei]